MKKFLLPALLLSSVMTAHAQHPTIVTPANNCTVFRNFNTTDEGFSSPSIYSDGNDVSFFWDETAGAEIENSGLTTRNGSLISPIYLTTEPGQVTVGFRYEAPPNTQYRIRVITGLIGSPLEIIATTANGPVYTPLPSTSGNICLLLSDEDITMATQVRFEFTFRATQPGNVLFDDLALTVAGGPLPVNFLGFVARRNTDGTIKLMWNVADEVNVKGYYVESSTNGVDFTNAGYVAAGGKDNYSLDHSRLIKTTFFRVKNVDFDNRSKYTPIIKVTASEKADSQVQVYPVPARDVVTVDHNKSSDRSVITLLSPDGKVMKRVTAIPNTLQTQVNINDLNRGVYIIRYDDGQGKVESVKMIKN